jgi:hypothetical protein
MYLVEQADNLYKALPESLRELTLRDCEAGILGCLHPLFANPRNLKTLRLETMQMTAEERKQLKGQAVESGLKIQLVAIKSPWVY